MIRQEMMQIASNLRNETNYSDQEFKTSLIQRLEKEYVSTGIMTRELFNAELNNWIDDI